MPRCVPDADNPPHGGSSHLEHPSIDGNGGVGSPCWSDCGVWDVKIEWVDGRPRMVPVLPSMDPWEDVSVDSVIEEASRGSLLDHQTQVATSSGGNDPIGWFRSHEQLNKAVSTLVRTDAVSVEPQQDALVPASWDDQPSAVQGRRVPEKPSPVTPASKDDGKSTFTAPTKREDWITSVPPSQIICPDYPGEKQGKGSDQAVDMRRQSPAKRSRAAAQHHNLSERRRRDKFNQNLRKLQRLLPNPNSKADKVSVLDNAISYTRCLQSQVDMMGAIFSPTMMMAMSMMNPMVAETARQLEMVSMVQMPISMTAAGWSSLPYVGLPPTGNPFAAVLASQAQQKFWSMNTPATAAQIPRQINNITANIQEPASKCG